MRKKERNKKQRNIMKAFEAYVGQIVKTRFDTVNRY